MDLDVKTSLPDPNKILYAQTYIKTNSKLKASQAAQGDYSEDLETIDLIKELQAELKKNAAIDLESHLIKLAVIRDEAMDYGKLSVALNAEIARGKAAGLYIERTQLDINELTNVSSQELRRRLMEISKLTDEPPVKHVESLQIEDKSNVIDVEDEKPISKPGSFAEASRRASSSDGSAET